LPALPAAVAWLLLGAAVAGLSCSTRPASAPSGEPAAVITSPDGLELSDATRRGSLYLRRDHHIGSYDAFYILPFAVSFRRGAVALSPAEVQRLGRQLRAALERSIEESGVGVAAAPGPCAAGLRVRLADLEVYDKAAERGAQTKYLSSAGSVLMIFELSDSASRQTLMRYGRRLALPGGRVGSSGSLSTAGLSQGIAEMMQTLGKSLAEIVPETTVRRRDVGCRGVIADVAGRGVPASD